MGRADAARSLMSLLIRNGTILTMNDAFEVIEGDVSIRDGRVAQVGQVDDATHDRVVDAAGALVMPGLIQTHVHLCQTLFRGMADDLVLMDWLRTRVWPLEAAHTTGSLRASARLSACELLLGGTTAVLTMETVHDTDVVCEEIAQSGLRATIGKCLMDADPDVPARLREPTVKAIDDALTLKATWDGKAEGRLRIAFAPRFAVSCSRELLEAVGALSARDGMLVHTHASESRGEVDLVRARTGMDNLPYLAAAGLVSPRLCAAHCVWVDDEAQALIAGHDVKVLHCPGSNLKLGSGLAPVVELRDRGVVVSLGADGAACNNRLDMFEEMRLAATLQAVRLGPGRLSARDAVQMATRDGARTLGLDAEIGSIEIGKRADVIVVGRRAPHQAPAHDPYATLVYATSASDVRATVIDGHVLVDQGQLTGVDLAATLDLAGRHARQLAERAGLA
jgi:5-methylthioadenosine/S-adenosylhomocysteine deaminase